MSPSFVLLTGATGFLGMQILKELLETEHCVRIVSRSISKGEHVKEVFSAHAARIEVVLIDDQLSPGAYDGAAQEVDAVIHTASPFIMNAKDNRKDLLNPAKKMVANMFAAASKSPSVKRIVITSSLAAVVNPFEGGLLCKEIYTATSWNPITEEKAEGPVLGYLASKTLAEREAWALVDNKSNSTWSLSNLA